MWIVTVTWNDQPEPDQNEPGETNPLAKEWDFRIVSTNREEVMVKDLEDTPIASSAGEPIRGVTREVADFAIVLSGNMAVGDIDFETIAEHMNQVNNALFFNVLAGNAKLVRFEGQRVRHPDFGYYFVTSWEFAVRDGGWDIEVLDEGFFELNGDGDQVIIAVKQEDEDGNEGEAIPVSEPHLLDGSGHRTDTPNYLTFKRVTQKNMAALNIPTNFGAL